MKRKWFRAKKHGNGWGLPLTWEGWTILIAYLLFLVGSFIWIDIGKIYESDTLLVYIPILSGATIFLVVILFLTGERSEWHRPGKKRK